MKKVFIILLSLIVCVGSLFAGYYEKGDTEFSLRAGVITPGIQFFPERTEDKFFAFNNVHMSRIGGYGSLGYQVFINKQSLLGGEVGYNFISSSEGVYLAVIPFTVKYTYVPVQNGKFDLNLHANAGLSLLKYNGHRFFPAPYASFTVNPVFFITDNWGFGLETGIWASMEFYTAVGKRNSNCITAMVPATITAIYRH